MQYKWLSTPYALANNMEQTLFNQLVQLLRFLVAMALLERPHGKWAHLLRLVMHIAPLQMTPAFGRSGGYMGSRPWRWQ